MILLVLCYVVLSSLVFIYFVLSCLVLSCFLLSCLFFSVLLFSCCDIALSCFVIILASSCLVLWYSCLVLSWYSRGTPLQLLTPFSKPNLNPDLTPSALYYKLVRWAAVKVGCLAMSLSWLYAVFVLWMSCLCRAGFLFVYPTYLKTEQDKTKQKTKQKNKHKTGHESMMIVYFLFLISSRVESILSSVVLCCLVLSCLAFCCFILSCLALHYLTLSCVALSYLVLSCLW